MKTVLFDIDGTIADTFDIGMRILNDIAKQYGKRDLTGLKTEEIKLKDAKQVIKYLGIPFWNVPKCVSIARKEMSKKLDSIQLFEGIKEVLQNLKNQYSLGIVTSNGENNIKQMLSKNGIDIFEVTHFGSSLFGKDKVIMGLLKKHKINKNDAIYVGDEVRDIKATKKIGIPIISVTWGYNAEEILAAHDPKYIARTPKDIEKHLLRDR